MKKSALVRIVVWTAIALALITVLGSFAENNMGWRFPVFHIGEIFWDSSWNTDHVLSSGTVSGDGVNDVSVSWVSGPVEISLGAEDSAIKYTEYASEKVDPEYACRVEVSGGKLVVEQYHVNNGWIKGLSFDKGKNHASRMVLELPTKLYNLVKVNQVSGTTKINQLNGTTLELNTVSGKVELDGVTFTDAKVNTVSGNLSGTVTFDSLAIDAVSAAADFKGKLNKVSLGGVSGNLKLESSVALGSLTASTVSGRIELTQPDGDGFRIKTSREISKMVSSDFALTTSNSTSGYYKDSNASALYKFSAISGKVKINKS